MKTDTILRIGTCCLVALLGACGGLEEELDDGDIQKVEQASVWGGYWKLVKSGATYGLPRCPSGTTCIRIQTGDIHGRCSPVGAMGLAYKSYKTTHSVTYVWHDARCVNAWGCNGRMANIVGTSGADVLRGTSSNDVIVGLGGDDTIYGGDGNDIICGDEGNDKIFGENGDDKLFGLGGNDVLNGGAGTDTCDGGANATTVGDKASYCESVVNVP